MEASKKINLGVEVLPIDSSRIEEYWPLVHFLIAEALVYSGKYAEANDIKKLLISGENQLFLIFGSENNESNKVYGVATTRIFENPNYKELQGLICTGTKNAFMGREINKYFRKFCKNKMDVKK